MNNRIPPHHLETEQALLGSILLRSDAYDEVSSIIHSKDFFYDPRHKKIFESMQKTAEQGKPIDTITLSKQLEDDGLLNEVGGRTYLMELSSIAPSSTHTQTYAETVVAMHTKRHLIQAAEEIAEIGYSNEQNIDHLMNEAEAKIFSLSEKEGVKTYGPISGRIAPLIEHLNNIAENQNNVRGIHTGFHSLDKKLSGFQKSDLIILAARPSVGKTAFALDIARKTALENDLSVGVFSLEMSNDQLIERMVASEAYIDAWTLRNGIAMKNAETQESIMNAVDRLGNASILVDDRAGINILALQSTARRMKREHNIDLLIVDYLQLIQPHATARSDSMVQQVSEVSRTLKHIARELAIPVIALSQLSREVEKRQGEPRLSDLRESGSIEQDADIVMFLHRTALPQEDEAPIPIDLIISKHRNGPIGRLHFAYNKQKVTFEEWSKKHGEQADVYNQSGSMNNPYGLQ